MTILRKTNLSFCLLLALFLISGVGQASFAQSQEEQGSGDTTRVKVIVRTNNGNEYIGYILSDDGRDMLIETTRVGKIYLRKADVRSITAMKEEGIKETGNGDYRSAGPFTTRYHFTTNALPIKKNENYAVVRFYGPEVHFAVSDRLSVGIMSTWLGSPLILAVKYTIPTKNPMLNFGVGTLTGTSSWINNFKSFGTLNWGMVTYGDRFNNITFSAGYSYIFLGREEISQEKPGKYPVQYNNGVPSYPIIPTQIKEINRGITAPAFGLAGAFKVGRRASFVIDAMGFLGRDNKQRIETTNLYDTNGQLEYIVKRETKQRGSLFYLMPGMRFQPLEKHAFQISLAGVSLNFDGESGAIPLPMFAWYSRF